MAASPQSHWPSSGTRSSGLVEHERWRRDSPGRASADLSGLQNPSRAAHMGHVLRRASLDLGLCERQSVPTQARLATAAAGDTCGIAITNGAAIDSTWAWDTCGRGTQVMWPQLRPRAGAAVALTARGSSALLVRKSQVPTARWPQPFVQRLPDHCREGQPPAPALSVCLSAFLPAAHQLQLLQSHALASVSVPVNVPKGADPVSVGSEQGMAC